jgi:uncharacterized membrane protein YgaE (UPF0421/DUF939 family)
MKKLDPLDATNHFLTAVCLLFIIGILVVIAILEPLILLVLAMIPAFLSLPYGFAYLWNRFIATEDEYYGD